MEFLKKYKVFESNDDKIKKVIDRVLSEQGWVNIDKKHTEKWEYQLEYKISDSLKIRLVYQQKYDDSGLQYMLVETNPQTGADKTWWWMFNYFYDDDSFNDEIYDDYERMMTNCDEHLEYFKLRPDDIDSVDECFMEIFDILGPTTAPNQYGYISEDFPNGSMYDDSVVEMPAPYLNSKLAVILAWRDVNMTDEKMERLEDELYYTKDRIKDHFNYTDVSLVYSDADDYADYDIDELFIKIQLN